MRDIYNLTYEKFSDYLFSIGEKRSKADILFPAFYRDNITDFKEASVKDSLSLLLKKEFYFGEITCIDKKCSDSADKYLFKLKDGNLAETVLMKHEYGNNICVSTQVGCNMGCAFCRSGRLKKVRNLETAEMVEQLLYVTKESGRKIGGIAIMGIGEPLDNYESVADFIDIAMYQKGFDIGLKHITLSTCGIVPKIYELAKLHLGITLSVSLHAPNDEIRQKTMPIARKYSIEELLQSCRDYFGTTGRRVTFEYSMISGVNDSDENARELANRLSGMNCHVNLIPVNTVEGTGYIKSNIKRQQSFIDILAEKNITATVRRTLGSDINASCGQLKRNHILKGGK